MGLCPKFSAVFSVIPNPVFGGAVLMMFGTILVNGMKIIMESEQTGRTQTILAVALAIGIGFNSFPMRLPSSRSGYTTMLCGVPGTAFAAVILNIVLPGRNLKKRSPRKSRSEVFRRTRPTRRVPRLRKTSWVSRSM